MFPNLVTYAIHKSSPLPSSDAVAYQYILAGNGVFLRAGNRFVSVIMPLVRCRVRGLPALTTCVQLKVPRLPAFLLDRVVADARRGRSPNGALREALYYFHHHGATVRVVRPAQSATAASVNAPGGPADDVILELHSHGDMRAFWSAIDDADETGFRFYAVIGRLDRSPEMRLRLGVYGYRMEVPLAALFAGAIPLIDCFPAQKGDISRRQKQEAR